MKNFVILPLAAAALLAAVLPASAQVSGSVASLDMTAAPHLDREAIRIVQLGLRNKGINPGPIDGVAGPHTREAVRAFQTRYGMKPSGELDNQLLFALGDADVAASAAR